MTAVKTEIGAETPAQRAPFAPVSGIPKSNVWAAIKYVYDTLTAAIAEIQAFTLSEDTTPQLGGNLDLNSHNITGTGNISITGDATVTDLAYDASSWNGSAKVPTRNAVRDVIELILGTTLPAAYQPLDSDLTAIAALTTTSFGRAVLALADAAAARTAFGLVIGTNVQAFDADLSTWAGLTPSANAQSLVTAANYAAMRTLLDVYSTGGAAAAFQAIDAQLSSLIRQNSQSAAYGIVATDSGYDIFHPAGDNNARTFTIPANGTIPLAIGTVLSFTNMANVLTIAITSDTLTQAGTGATGSRTLAANGIAVARKIASAQWIISGVGLT